MSMLKRDAGNKRNKEVLIMSPSITSGEFAEIKRTCKVLSLPEGMGTGKGFL